MFVYLSISKSEIFIKYSGATTNFHYNNTKSKQTIVAAVAVAMFSLVLFIVIVALVIALGCWLPVRTFWAEDVSFALNSFSWEVFRCDSTKIWFGCMAEQ